MKSFSEMNLNHPLVEALKRMNFVNPTDVQEKVIPIAVGGKDLIVRAKTGTGKTCAFLIPIKQMSRPSRDLEALIIAPTRELALQITGVANKLRLHQEPEVVTVYGGASINNQISALRRNPRIVVGTPGRILDLIDRGALRIDRIRFLVLDEADTMFDMGFIEDIEKILEQTPREKQTLLFSATMPEKIVNVARRHMHDFSMLQIGDEDEVIVSKIRHIYAVVDNRLKFAALLAYIDSVTPKKAIIFAQTQYAADAIYEAMHKRELSVVLMHGGLSQAKREQALRQFKVNGRFLIATNVAARGIDIAGISDIINFDIPDDPHTYVHRVGRSARMNTDGRAFTIVGSDQRNIVRDIEYMTKIKMERIILDTHKYKDIQVFRRRNWHGGEGRRGTDRGGRRDRGYGGRREGRGGGRDESFRQRGFSSSSR